MKIGEVKHWEEIVTKFEDEFYWSSVITKKGEEFFYSANIEKVTGYQPAEILAHPKKLYSIIKEQDLPRYKKFSDELRISSSQDNGEIEFRLVRKDKKVIWVKERLKISRNKNGRITQLFGHVSDITGMKNGYEKLREQIEELEQLNFSKDNFISVLSHDLRAPFTSILGFSEILLHEPSISEKEKAEYLNYINDSSQNQLKLINYLLDWSRLQTGRLKINKQRLNAQSVIFNCVSSLTGAAVRKNINIKVDIAENIFIDADERLFMHVITSMLSNAVKFSTEDSNVEITANIFNQELVEFIVSDDGVGIPEVNKAKLFDIGKMFSTEGTKGERGTGLGLTLSKKIIEKHNGQIWFYSSEGVGTEFHFTLPASANTILVVTNDRENRTKLEKDIEKNYSAFKIVCAENGFEALNIVSARMPSLIIIDHDMPLMNGIQFVQSLLKENKNSRIPMIALVKPEFERTNNSYQEIGINTVLSHPLDLEQLEKNVQSMLS